MCVFFSFESCFLSTSVTHEMLFFSSCGVSLCFLFFSCIIVSFIFLFTKRIMLFVLSTVKQSLLQHWKAISLYETFTMYLLWLTFDSSLLFTCTLGVIIEVNLFYTNTNRVLLCASFLLENIWGFEKQKYSQRKRDIWLETRNKKAVVFFSFSALFIFFRWVFRRITDYLNKMNE